MPSNDHLINAEELAAVEAEHAHWLAIQTNISGVEAHVEPDATWLVHSGAVWGNCAIQLRFTPETVESRLKTIVARYRGTRRGAGFWVSPFATPVDLPDRLRQHGFRCRKYFPAMFCNLAHLPKKDERAQGITIEVVDDHHVFTKHAHPYFGPMTTPLRRFELKRLAALSALRPKQVWDFVAIHERIPVGACTLFIDGGIAGFHDVGVLKACRRQGIGSALMQHACEFARMKNCIGAVLISSGEGYGMYQRAGFREVGRIGYWYRQFRE